MPETLVTLMHDLCFKNNIVPQKVYKIYNSECMFSCSLVHIISAFSMILIEYSFYSIHIYCLGGAYQNPVEKALLKTCFGWPVEEN